MPVTEKSDGKRFPGACQGDNGVAYIKNADGTAQGALLPGTQGDFDKLRALAPHRAAFLAYHEQTTKLVAGAANGLDGGWGDAGVFELFAQPDDLNFQCAFAEFLEGFSR